MIPPGAYLAFDASHWNRLNYGQIAAAGVKALLFKISQGNDIQDAFADDHLYGARATGMRWMPWHWVDPLDSISVQVANILDKLSDLGITPNCFGLDVEQYWADWNEYLNHEPITQIIPPAQISSVSLGIAAALRSRGMQIAWYTRARFIQDYALPLMPYLANDFIWWAQWIYSARPQVTTSWASFLESYTPTISTPPFYPAWTGTRKTDAWQWTGDKFILPGTNGGSIDIDLVYQSLYDRLNYNDQPPARYIQITSPASYVRLREGASTSTPEVGRTFQGKRIPYLGEVMGDDGYIWYKGAVHVRSDLAIKTG